MTLNPEFQKKYDAIIDTTLKSIAMLKRDHACAIKRIKWNMFWSGFWTASVIAGFGSAIYNLFKQGV